MNRKIWKALGIAVCMLALAAPRAMAETHWVRSDADFKKAVEEINQSSDEENEIILDDEVITLEGDTTEYTLRRGRTTIKGKGHKISIKSKAEIKVTGGETVLNLGANGYDKKLTIDGDTMAAFIVVSGGATANMNENVTLQNRMFTGNAYVLVTGSKSVFNMKGGVIEGGSRAVIAQSGATFNMSGGKIRNCVSTNDGGGVHVYEATFIMDGGTISGCTAADNGGGLCADNSTITIKKGTISRCTAAKNGGGLYAKNSSKITITGGTISGCETSVGAGGGLCADNSTLNIEGGTISGCTAREGGGLYANNSAVTIKGGTISGCTAENNGGGLYAINSSTNSSTVNISGGTISECTARNNGGGLYATNSSTNSSIVNISGGIISGCEGRWGGGLYADNSTINIEGGTISGCTAVLGNGGGLYAKNSSTITINNGTISGSTISGCTASAGGGLYADKSTITINNGTISECTAAMNEGGGLYATNSSKITISGGTISGCKAPSSDKGNGSGLYANHSTIKITGGTISGCEGRWGGGLYANNSTVTITGGTISRCNVGAGGGLFVTGSTLNIEGGTISECSTTLDSGKGGGLYAENSTITISGGTIENNKAARGGGVALTNSTVKKDEQPIRNWTVVGNKAYKTGGGIWLGWGENVKKWDISDKSNKIYNNHAIEHGADICLEGGTSAIKLPIAANMYHDSSINIDNWYKDDNPRHKPSESGEVVKANKWLNGGLSLVASYTVIPVRIEIDANGGVGGSVSQTVHEGTTVTLEAPTKEGYLFTGWEDENKKIYPAGEDGKVNITVNENMKLRAVWEARTFTVTYVLLNGETRTKTVNYGQKVTLGEEPRTGYTFVGWKDGEKMYHAGETITVTEDKTLTAVWDTRSFTVTYVLLNGKTRTETAAYGQNVTLGEEPRTGYTFVGWKDGEKVYHAGETITVTGDMTLTAEWKKLPSAENLPKTGDESPVLLWGAALAVSAAACFVLRRRK